MCTVRNGLCLSSDEEIQVAGDVEHWQIELLKEVVWRSGPRVLLPSSLCARQY